MHLILNIGKSTGLKVAQFLRSNLSTEAKLTYPYLDSAKKLLLEVTNIRGNNFLNYFIGKNIKRVTWDGDNVSTPTHGELFCSDFSRYLDDDANQTAGDYDVYNSGVSVISKEGPLPDAYARYIIEFNKEPKPGEDLNLFVTFQGLANFQSIDNYLSSAVTGADISNINLYTDTTALGYFDPPLNTNTFTPVSSDGAYVYSHKDWSSPKATNSGMIMSASSTTFGTIISANRLPAGHYYMYTIDFFSDVDMTGASATPININDVTVISIGHRSNGSSNGSIVATLWSINVPADVSFTNIFSIKYVKASTHYPSSEQAFMITKTS